MYFKGVSEGDTHCKAQQSVIAARVAGGKGSRTMKAAKQRRKRRRRGFIRWARSFVLALLRFLGEKLQQLIAAGNGDRGSLVQ